MRTKILLAGLGLVALAAVLLPSGDAQAQSVLPPSTIGCTAQLSACHGGTGVCNGLVPDAGSDAGVLAGRVRAYHVYMCPPVGASITATGSVRNFHCHASTGKCAEVAANRQSITTALSVAQGAALGVGTGAPECWEAGPFTVPYYDNSADSINWIPVGVTVTAPDGGALTTYICPAQ